MYKRQAIKALLKEIDPTLQHEATAEYSRFLYDTTVPMSMARFYVHITQKTNILKGEYDQPAQKAEVSLEDIMKMPVSYTHLCYFQSELPEGSQAIRKNKDWSKEPCGSCSRRELLAWMADRKSVV